ncbi:MAG: transglycosylase domain-containing protein [Solirubrobacterales bacterium]
MAKGSSPDKNGGKTLRQQAAEESASKPRIRKFRILAITVGLLALAGISTIFGMMMAVASELPKLEDRQQYKVSKASVMYDDQGRVITRLRNNQNRILVTSDQISPVMKQAVVAIEDRRFYEHTGIDFRGIGRAIAVDVMGGGAKQGASTITQQFVKNALAAQNQRTVMQKLREVALAYHLEKQWTKDKILTEYLNAIYFGNGAYGIEAAAETYFAKAHPGCQPHCAEKLLPWEAALLAGVIASPSGYDPVAYPTHATERRNQVLTNMYNQGFITSQIYEQGKMEAVPTESEITRPKEDSAAPYFSTYVRQQLVDRYGAGTAFGGGLKVHTTLDLDMQHAAGSAIQSTLPAGGPSASLVAIDNKTGKILALYGGDDANYNNQPFNLATQGQRQPGSSFKPFTLITALKKGYGLGSMWKSSPIGKKGSGTYIKNYGDSYLGATSMLNATTTSDNTAYVRIGLAKKMGVNRIARQAKSMGISTQISRNTAMILGGLSEGVTPLEMAYAYTSIANEGRRPIGTLAPDDDSPVAIDKVVQNGKIFRKQRDRTKYDRVFSTQVGEQAQEALRSVVTSGTGKKADPGFWVAGKTGTTENYGDAWFVGFSQEISVAIWVGYPDKTTPMLDQFGGEPVAGGTFPALIFQNFITQAHAILAAHRAGKKGPTEDVSALVGTPDMSPYEGDTGGDTGGNDTGTTKQKATTNNNNQQQQNDNQTGTQEQTPATEPQQGAGNGGGGGGGADGGAAPAQ